MPEFVTPSVAYRDTFIAAVKEFQAGLGTPPWFVQDVDPEILTEGPDAFAAYVDRVVAERTEGHARRIGWVPMTTLWWVEDGEMLGRLAIRHRLTPALEKVGGHIGYDVRPSARLRGHATAMLAAALPIARSLGIDEALVTCDDTNLGSRKVIEANGGRFVDLADEKRRYWIPTAG